MKKLFILLVRAQILLRKLDFSPLELPVFFLIMGIMASVAFVSFAETFLGMSIGLALTSALLELWDRWLSRRIVLPWFCWILVFLASIAMVWYSSELVISQPLLAWTMVVPSAVIGGSAGIALLYFTISRVEGRLKR